MILPGTGTGIGRYGLSSLCYSTPTSVARGEPDLTVAVDAPVWAVQGESIQVNLLVQNLGNATASGSQTAGESGYRVELGLSKDLNIPVRPGNATAEFTEDMQLRRIAPTYDVAAGATVKYTSTVQIPENTPPGVYCLTGIVDTYGVVKEANEQNNTVCDRIEIKAKGETVTDTSGLSWVDFQNQKVGTRGEQFTSGLAQFYAPGGSAVLDLNADSFNELLFSGGRLEVTLPQSSYVSATLVHYASPVTIEARYGDKVVSTRQTSSTDGKADVVTISAEAMDKLILSVPKGSQGALAQLGFQAPNLSDDACDPRVDAIASGFRLSLAILKDGTVWAWGSNSTGQTTQLFSDTVIEKPIEVALKQALLYCPIVQQPLPVEEEPEEKPNPADAWKCTAAAFSDVPASDPACGAINMLVSAGVVSGYPDGTFKPQAAITRAAMAKLLVAALKLKPNPSGKVIFTDTTGHWAVAQGWLQVAVDNNIVGGYPDKTFRPDLPVNRSAAIKMAAGAVNIPRIGGQAIPELRTPYTPPTAHLKDVKAEDWFYDWVVLALRADLIGSEAPFPLFTAAQLEPSRDLTRGEAAILVANLLFFREQ